MSRLEDDSTSKINELFNRQAFFSSLEKELNRVHRYGHRATFLLIKNQFSDKISEDYEKFLFEEIKKRLRNCDTVYAMGNGTFAAILPDTHEGGGEFVALRLKREISRIASAKGMNSTLNIGIVNSGPELLLGPEAVFAALERDLERDNRCQAFFPEAHGVSPGKKGRVLLLPPGLKGLEAVKRTLEPSCNIFQLGRGMEKIPSGDEIEQCVMVLDQEDDHSRVIENIRKNSKLKDIFKIFLGTPGNPHEYDLVVPGDYKPEFLCYSILRAFSRKKHDTTGNLGKYTQALAAISAATHQLNQPLQIILGKMELMLLDLDRGHLGPEEIKKLLAEIRRHILLSADINQKINRLSKV